MPNFKINNLDHVAIRVKDMKTSIEWYETVLGLKKYQFDKWGDFPIFMLSGQVGVAIFPVNLEDGFCDKNSKNIKIDHFAFNVSNENLELAKAHYTNLGIEYDFQDHYYYHSIYVEDPDGHTVELTTLVVDAKTIFG